MCGIAGIVKLGAGEAVDEPRLKRMRDALRHRGPDGEGLWIEGPVGLAHRRLAIVDVAGGQQPMANEDETVWITYNGEIYNHAEIRADLESRGHRYRTRSDTETIVHLYEEEGDRCVERLRGMFAFALWDGPRGRLLLARDRLGIKPLYYAHLGDELLFASEIKAILAAAAGRPAFNEAVLPEFLATGFVAGEETFFKQIHKLLPGRTLSWSPAEGRRQRRYWTLANVEPDGARPFRAHVEDVRSGLQDAVRSHLMSDVPLGLFLSGGLDSSALAGIMASLVREPIRTFSVAFEEREANELDHARQVARGIRAEHREVLVTPGEFFESLPKLIWHEDEPIAFPSSIPLFFVSRLAAEHVKVVLTGEGADELFLGYNRYRVTAWNAALSPLYEAVAPAPIVRAVRRVVGKLPGSAQRYLRRSFLSLPPGPRSLFCENFSVFPGAFRDELLAASPPGGRDPHAEALRAYAEARGGPLERMAHADRETYLVELLMKQDQMSMAASVESRVPFLDHPFAERAARIPGRFKLRRGQTKAVLRAAVADLVPPEILTRSKMGFPVPLGRWLQGPCWPIVEEFVLGARARRRGLFVPATLRRLAEEHRGRARNHAARLWLLVNLEIWQRMFIDGEDVAQLRVAG